MTEEIKRQLIPRGISLGAMTEEQHDLRESYQSCRLRYAGLFFGFLHEVAVGQERGPSAVDKFESHRFTLDDIRRAHTDACMQVENVEFLQMFVPRGEVEEDY